MQITVTYDVDAYDVEQAVETAVSNGDIVLDQSDISSVEVS